MFQEKIVISITNQLAQAALLWKHVLLCISVYQRPQTDCLMAVKTQVRPLAKISSRKYQLDILFLKMARLESGMRRFHLQLQLNWVLLSHLQPIVPYGAVGQETVQHGRGSRFKPHCRHNILPIIVRVDQICKISLIISNFLPNFAV